MFAEASLAGEQVIKVVIYKCIGEDHKIFRVEVFVVEEGMAGKRQVWALDFLYFKQRAEFAWDVWI